MTDKITPKEAWPTEISLDETKSHLSVAFDTGETFTLSAEYLRTHSQSAEVKGHGKDQEVLVFGKKNILIEGVDAIGNYAIKITFSDGHDTGLYTWGYLYELGAKKEKYWKSYLQKLSEAQKER